MAVSGPPPAPARVPLQAWSPTPLQQAPRLSAELGVQIWLKRDDLTGFGLGGNKVRGLEYLLGDAEQQGCDCFVTGAGPQSNWASLAALAARVRGLEPVVIHYGSPTAPVGNLRLSTLIDADITFTGDADRASVDRAVEQRANELRARGRRPYAVPRGGATPHGALGYFHAAGELSEQLAEAAVQPAEVWLATGSCGTQAGLVAGAHAVGWGARITGVTVSRAPEECRQRVAELARDTAALAGRAAPPTDHTPVVVDGYIGPGYGRASPQGERAARWVASTEGVFLDPVFGAKAMAALVDRAEAGRLDGPVVFLVTGGAPTLFVPEATGESASAPSTEPSP